MAVGVLAATACSSDKKISGGTETVAVATSNSIVLVTTVADTGSPPTASSPLSTDPPTTTAVSLEVDPRLTIEPLAGVADACSEAGCPSVVFTTGGEIVTFDSATFSLTFTDSGRTVGVDAALGEQASLVAMGPEDVAYFTIVPPDAVDPIGFLVAVATDGPRAGTEVGSGAGPVGPVRRLGARRDGDRPRHGRLLRPWRATAIARHDGAAALGIAGRRPFRGDDA